jgi:hypothetical protein
MHKKNTIKEGKEEQGKIKTQEFNVVWQDCRSPQAATMMFLYH